MNHELDDVWRKTRQNLAKSYQNKNSTEIAGQMQLFVKTHDTYGNDNN